MPPTARSHSVARDGANGLFDLVRRDVLTSPDDDVLDPAGDEEVAAGHIGAVAGIEPAIAWNSPRVLSGF